jgi:hypothetical protein
LMALFEKKLSGHQAEAGGRARDEDSRHLNSPVSNGLDYRRQRASRPVQRLA